MSLLLNSVCVRSYRTLSNHLHFARRFFFFFFQMVIKNVKERQASLLLVILSAQRFQRSAFRVNQTFNKVAQDSAVQHRKTLQTPQRSIHEVNDSQNSPGSASPHGCNPVRNRSRK